MVRNRKARYAGFGVGLLVLSCLLVARGGTDGPGNGTGQTLTVTQAGLGSTTVTGPQIACGGDCTGSYARGTAVVLTATPEDGSTFAGWGGDCTGTTCELVMDGAKAVTATFEEADAVPASALGDSPTVTGMIANLGRGDFAGKALELKVRGFTAGRPDDVFASSPVADDGSFSLRLPGKAEMAPRLFDATPEIFGDPGCDTTVTPEVFKLPAAQDFFLYVDGQPADEVLQTSASNLGSTIVVYYYVDRDVTVTSTCAGGDFAGLETDIDMREGWNTVVLDLTALTYRNKDLSEGYQWVIPSLCSPDGECPAD